MRGIILAGGAGTRLAPLTKVTSKQLLPLYNKPMIYFPLETLTRAGITEILFIVAPDHAGDFVKLLGSGKDFGCDFSFEVQDKPEGLAQAFLIGEKFIGNEDVALILGDNFFEEDFVEPVKNFKSGALVFASKVPDPERFGVVEFDEENRVLSIEEKPETPKSKFAIPGVYIFDQEAVAIAKSLSPSQRGELEITDIQRHYLEKESLDVRVIGGAWFDMGTHESLFEASAFAREKNLGAQSHPMINDAILEFNTEYKKIVSLKK